MNLDLTDAQQHVQARARAFAAAEVAPRAAELDRAARWPADLVARLGELGLLGVVVPAEHGGAGLDHVSLALVIEEIGAACAGTGAITSVQNALFCAPLAAFGTPSQRREILAPALAGRATGCFCALTAHAQPTHAEKQADGSFVLTGSLRLVLAGPDAQHAIVLARTGADPEALHTTAFLVRRGTPGFTQAPPEDKMGLRAAASGALILDQVRVPADHVLGTEGDGAAVTEVALEGGRLGMAALAVGIARAAFEKASAHVRDLQGQPGARPAGQAVQFLIADMAVDVDAARLLVLHAAQLRDAGNPGTSGESAMAKLFAAEAATRVTHRAMQVLGGEGYTTAAGLERHYRDARLTEIDGGPSELQRARLGGGPVEG